MSKVKSFLFKLSKHVTKIFSNRYINILWIQPEKKITESIHISQMNYITLLFTVIFLS